MVEREEGVVVDEGDVWCDGNIGGDIREFGKLGEVDGDEGGVGKIGEMGT